jgi:hypothetical protein
MSMMFLVMRFVIGIAVVSRGSGPIYQPAETVGVDIVTYLHSQFKDGRDF